MVKVNHIAKWSKENGTWVSPSSDDIGHCFSIASYRTIINNPFDGIHYIIVASGSRLERNTNKFTYIDEKIYTMDHVFNHYKKQNGNYQIECFFIDKDAPIIESAKKFASYIDSLSVLSSTKSINIMGVSKCGAMSFYTPRFFKHNESFDKSNIFNVAVPYQGTKFASPDLIIPEIEAFSKRFFEDTYLSKMIYSRLLSSYQSGCSYSHMDFDVARQDSIGEIYLDSYDRDFIRNIFCSENVDSIREINSFKNFTTKTDSFTLPEAIATFNSWGITLCFINSIFFSGKADGLVPYESQKSVDDYINTSSIHLPSSHHDVNTNIRVCNQILTEIDKTIGPTLKLKK